jgi:hypothetical protein
VLDSFSPSQDNKGRSHFTFNLVDILILLMYFVLCADEAQRRYRILFIRSCHVALSGSDLPFSRLLTMSSSPLPSSFFYPNFANKNKRIMALSFIPL